MNRDWYNSHRQKWNNFLIGNGVSAEDADRLSQFFAAQDGLESAGGTSAAAKKFNYGGMQKNGKNIAYSSAEDYMKDKYAMMSSKFPHALKAKDITEYATMLGDPKLAGKNYLYYVTDKAPYNPKSAAWQAAQTTHMNNYINGMLAWAGQQNVKLTATVRKPTIRKSPGTVPGTASDDVTYYGKTLPDTVIVGKRRDKPTISAPKNRNLKQAMELEMARSMLKQSGMTPYEEDDTPNYYNLMLLSMLNVNTLKNPFLR